MSENFILPPPPDDDDDAPVILPDGLRVDGALLEVPFEVVPDRKLTTETVEVYL